MQWREGDVVMAFVQAMQGVRVVVPYTASIRKRDGMLVWRRNQSEGLVSFAGYSKTYVELAKKWVEDSGGIWAGEGGLNGEECSKLKPVLTLKQEMRRALGRVNILNGIQTVESSTL